MRAGEQADWPEYCCAILRDSRGRYLMERRPASAKKAAGLLTSFGGKREPGEPPEACIRRELNEELGWMAGALELCVRLKSTRNDRMVGWFFRGAGPEEGDRLVVEPDRDAVWIEACHLASPEISPWHRAAIDGERSGQTIVWIDA